MPQHMLPISKSLSFIFLFLIATVISADSQTPNAPLVTAWQTDNEGVSANEQSTIPGEGEESWIEGNQVVNQDNVDGSIGIDSCIEIDVSGVYHLTGDIEPDNPGEWENQDSCIIITVSSVTLDGNGYTIDGTNVSEEGEDVPGTRGILVRNVSYTGDLDDSDRWLNNIEIRNVTFEYWQAPLLVQGVSAMVTSNITLNNSGSAADLYFEYGAGVTVDSVDATGDVDTRIVSINDVTDPVVTNVTAERVRTYGQPVIDIDTSPRATISDNEIDDRDAMYPDNFTTHDYGIRIANSYEATITGNEVRNLEGHEGGDGFGIFFVDHTTDDESSHEATVTDNEMTDVDIGIHLASSNETMVADNIFIDSDGIHVGDVVGATVTANQFIDGSLAIELRDSEQAVVTENDITNMAIGMRHIDADIAEFEANEFQVRQAGIVFQTDITEPDPIEFADVSIVGGDIHINRPHVSLSGITIEDGQIRVWDRIGFPASDDVTISEAELVNFESDDAAIEIEDVEDITLENSTIRDGEEHAFFADNSNSLTIDNLTVTGQEGTSQWSGPTIVALNDVEGATVTDLTVSGTTASPDHTVETLQIHNSHDIDVDGFTSSDNDGIGPAIDISRSEEVSLSDSDIMPVEDGAIGVDEESVDAVGSNVTVGAGSSSETTVSFEAQDVVIGDKESPPENPDATGIGRYLFAEGDGEDSSLDLDIYYSDADTEHIDESNLRLWQYSENDDTWNPVDGSSVDTDAKMVSANITEFSVIGVFSDDTGLLFPAFTIDPESPAVEEGVTFDASGSSAPEGTIETFEWDFTGDGTVDVTSSDPVVTHAYEEPGEFDVTLKIEDEDGETADTTRTVFVDSVDTGSETESDLPEAFALKQNYPNPFNPVTVIRYQLPEAGNVRLEVFDIMGRRVETLVEEQKQPGYYEVTFDASDLSSGTYIYRIETGDFSDTMKMLFVK